MADIVKSHNLQYHFFADDTQLYDTFKTNCDVDAVDVDALQNH